MLDFVLSLSVWQLVLSTITTVVLVYGLIENLGYKRKAGSLNGPSYVLPFVGEMITMVREPFRFYDELERYGDICWTSIVGLFVVFTSKAQITRKVFANHSEGLRLWLTVGAKRILGDNNIAFLHGQTHADFRKQLRPLFSKKALSIYLHLQEALCRQGIEKWCKDESKKPMRIPCRDMNVLTSVRVFIGEYMNHDQRLKYNHEYLIMNEGFFAFPVPLPGSALWNAIKSRHLIVDMLQECVRQSKTRMAAGEEPTCLLDVWMESIIPENNRRAAAGEEQLPHTDDYDVACAVLDFLFASQDATTSALVWTCTLLADNPDVLKRVRDEQKRVRPNGEEITFELLEQMTFTRQTMREILRFRPPATMVPHVAIEDTPITDDYTIPKGSVVLPSIWCAHFQGFENAYTFDPDRFGEERREHVKFNKNLMPFGFGTHICLGREYAQQHLMVYISCLTEMAEWQHHLTDKSDGINFLPTIFPADDGIVSWKRLSAPYAVSS